MGIDLASLLGGAVKPVTDLIDNLSTSKEEKMQLQLAMATMVSDAAGQLQNAQRDIILAEAMGESWLQKNWRPLIMCLFGAILAWNFMLAPLGTWIALMFGGPVFPALAMPVQFWTLLTVGIGGYIGAREVGKGINKWAEVQVVKNK